MKPARNLGGYATEEYISLRPDMAHSGEFCGIIVVHIGIVINEEGGWKGLIFNKRV